jgi:Fe-S-cluster containining protein
MNTIFGEVTRAPRRLIPLTLENREAAQRKAAMLNEKMRPRLREWSQRLTALVNGREPVRWRLRALYRIADEMTAIAAPYAVCKKGCSACCHMATMVSEPEAEMMAADLRIKMRKPKEWPFFDARTGLDHAKRDEFAESFHDYNKPCPFLVNNACSIYESRPLACRVHLNLAANAEPCQMDAPRETAMLDLRKLDDAYALIGRTFHLADIREYFPKGRRK